ncbi:hypothetical protein BGY98DRAFT_1029874 [Russula aff. rugulosa BPL654]|nr:hypothetical protein BGY98DRAFT_1029874 [Russula aff. rugulosa BPL654]
MRIVKSLCPHVLLYASSFSCPRKSNSTRLKKCGLPTPSTRIPGVDKPGILPRILSSLVVLKSESTIIYRRDVAYNPIPNQHI